MRQGQNRFDGLVNDRIRQETSRGSHLRMTHEKAVNDILANRDRVFGLHGVAGSGKTTTLREVRVAAARDGYKAQGLAPPSRATAKRQEAGINSKTLHRNP